MNRHYLEDADISKDDPNFGSGLTRFDMNRVEQPRRSPIRRKDKLRQEMGQKSKAKRDYKKIQYKIKYDWQGE
jgi:hypothetical protein